jgi:tRNA G10  N-methylase Trm11
MQPVRNVQNTEEVLRCPTTGPTHLLSLTAQGGRFCSNCTSNLRNHCYAELLSLMHLFLSNNNEKDDILNAININVDHDLTLSPQRITLPTTSMALFIARRLITMDLFEILVTATTPSELRLEAATTAPVFSTRFHLLHYNYSCPRMGRKGKKRVCQQFLEHNGHFLGERCKGPRSSYTTSAYGDAALQKRTRNTPATLEEETTQVDYLALLTFQQHSCLVREPDTSCLGTRSLQKMLQQYQIDQRPFPGLSPIVPNLSFVALNISKIQKGDMVLDPYCGTGSLLLLPTKLGALCIGTDINKTYFEPTGDAGDAGDAGETCTSKTDISRINTRNSTLQSNFDFYNLPVPDLFIANTIATKHHYRQVPFLRAILTDVPYGFRKPRVKHDNGTYDDRVSSPTELHNAVLAMVRPLYVLGRDLLVVGGRLVFFFPTFAQQKELVLDEVSLGLNEFNRVNERSSASSFSSSFSSSFEGVEVEGKEVDGEDCVQALRLVCVCTEQFKQFQRNLVCVEKRVRRGTCTR